MVVELIEPDVPAGPPIDVPLEVLPLVPLPEAPEVPVEVGEFGPLAGRLQAASDKLAAAINAKIAPREREVAFIRKLLG